ncbi:hypothetical protein GTY86_33775 [Streptomyces sp. SID5770]|nr:hypothetical protein [Streptomyces sp. SID5770]MZE56155.1 hypothetical protein [Streptomyces sp. SID5770]
MTDKPETPSQRMSRMIRETPPRDAAQRMRESIRRTLARRKNGEDQ